MFLSADRETLRWIQKTLSRARRSGNWAALFAREACWTPEIFAGLVDEHDRLQLEGHNDLAAEIAGRLPQLAERIRPNLCPGEEQGKRSLESWALAIFGSGLRATGRSAEATVAFVEAFERAKKGTFGWARGEVERRFAVHLLHQNDRRAFERVERAIGLFADHPDQLAECFNLRGVCRALFDDDASGAIQDFGIAASISDPSRSERSGWAFQAALQNLAFQLVKGGPCTLESLSQGRKLLLASRSFLGKGMDVRKVRSLWVEGLLVYRIGWNRHGERLLERARQLFLKLGRSEEYAIATLDLAVMLVGDGEEPRAAELLRTLRRDESAAIPGIRPSLDLEGVQETRRRLVESLSRPAPLVDGRLPHKAARRLDAEPEIA